MPSPAPLGEKNRKLKRTRFFFQSGNQKLKEQKYEEAIESYTEALKIDPFNKKLNAIIYANRALAYMKVQKYEQGRDDCDASIDLDPNYYKVFASTRATYVEER